MCNLINIHIIIQTIGQRFRSRCVLKRFTYSTRAKALETSNNNRKHSLPFSRYYSMVSISNAVHVTVGECFLNPNCRLT